MKARYEQLRLQIGGLKLQERVQIDMYRLPLSRALYAAVAAHSSACSGTPPRRIDGAYYAVRHSHEVSAKLKTVAAQNKLQRQRSCQRRSS